MDPESESKVNHGVTVTEQPPLYPNLEHTSPPGQPPHFPGQPPHYPAQPPHYPGPPPGPQVVISPVMVTQVVPMPLGPQGTGLTCRSCHADIITKVEISSATKTHIFAALLCLFGCWPCVCIPYCMDSCKNINHYCPNCNAYLGSYNK